MAEFDFNGIDLNPDIDFNGINLNPEPDFTGLDLAENERQRQANVSEASAKKQKVLDDIARTNAQEAELRRINNEHSVLDTVADSGLALTEGAVGIGELAYGAADLISRGVTLDNYSLDEATGGFSENFGETRKALNSFKSEKLQLQNQEIEHSKAGRVAGKADRIKALTDRGYSENQAAIIDELKTSFESAKDVASRPLVAFDETLKSLAYIVGPGATAALVTKGMFRGMSAKKSAEFLASPAGKVVADKIATRAGIGFVAAAEGLSNAVSAKGDVLGMSPEDLQTSPLYKKLIASGEMSHEEARMEVSEKVFDMTAMVAGSVGAVSSAITGAGKFEAQLFDPTSTVGKKLFGKILGKTTKIAGGIAREGVEEFIQGGGGEIAGNIATQEYVDPAQELLENSGDAAGVGAVAGSLSTVTAPPTLAALQATAAVVKASPKIAKVAVEAAKATPGAIVDVAKAAPEVAKTFKEENVRSKEEATGDFKDLESDPTKEGYDALRSTQQALHSSNVPADDASAEERQTHLDQVDVHKNNMINRLIELTEQSEANPNEDPKAPINVEIKRIQDNAAEIADKVNKLREGIEISDKGKAAFASNVRNAEITESTEEADNLGNTILRSARSGADLSVQQINNILQNGNLSESTKTQLTNYRDTQSAIANLTIDDVHSQIVHGGKGNVGLIQHQATITERVDSGNKSGTQKVLEVFGNFRAGQARKNKAFQAAIAEPNEAKANAILAKYAEENGSKLYTKVGIRNLAPTVAAETAALNAAYTESLQQAQQAFPDIVGHSAASQKTVAEPTTTTERAAPVSSDEISQEEFFNEVHGEGTTSSANSTDAARTNADAAAVRPETRTGNTDQGSTTSSAVSDTGVLVSSGLPKVTLEKQESRQGITILTVRDKDNTDVGFVSLGITADSVAISPDIEKGKGLGQATYLAVSKLYPTKKIVSASELSSAAETMWNRLHKKGIATKTQIGKFNNGEPEYGFTIDSYNKRNSNTLNTGVLTDYSLTGSLQKSPTVTMKGKSFQATTVLSFTQNVSSKLHTVANFFSELGKENTSTTNGNVAEDIANELTEKQLNGLTVLQDFIDKFITTHNSTIGKNLGKAQFKEDLSLLLTDSEGNFDENVLTTLGVVGYNWLATRASGTLYNDAEAIASILGLNSENDVSGPAYKLLSKVGSSRNTVIEDLGASAMTALGLSAKSEVGGEIADNMQMALGITILGNLLAQGAVSQTAIPNTEMQQHRDSRSAAPVSAEATSNFIRIAVDPKSTEDTTTVDEIDSTILGYIQSTKESEKVIQELFGIDSFQTGPLLDEPTNVSNKVKGTTQIIASKVMKVLRKHVKRKHTIKQGVHRVIQALGRDNVLTMQGYNSDVKGTVQEANHDTAVGINASIVQAYDHYQEFTGELEKTGLTTPFYFMHEVWKNSRLGMVSNTVNIQGNKFHRHLIAMENWQVTISSQAERTQFKIAVAEAFGFKVDTHTVQESSDFFDSLLAGPTTIQAGIAAITQLNQGQTLSEAQQSDILAAVAQGREKTYSLDGLVALANYSETESFETDLFREVDGITNGVIIGLIQLAAVGDFSGIWDMLARGGVFTKKADYASFTDFVNRPGNEDSYKDMARTWVKELNKIFSENRSTRTIQVEQGLRSFVGTLMDDDGTINSVGRNLAKNPLMITNYGANVQRVVDEFGEKVIASVYNKIEEAYNKGDFDQLSNIADDLNAALGSGAAYVITEDNALSFDFKKHHVVMAGIVEATYGTALETAINEKFGAFTKARTEVNNMANIAFESFNLIYQNEVNLTTTALHKKDSNASLSRADLAAIFEKTKAAQPLFRHYHSATDTLDDNVSALKSNNTRSIHVNDKTSVAFKDRVAGHLSMKAFSAKRTPESPGVSSVILLIHSIDSAVMVDLLDKFSALNVHDAAGFSLLDVAQGTEAMNQAFLDVMGNYDLREEVHATLERSVASLAAYDKQNGTALTKVLSQKFQVANKADDQFLGKNFHEDGKPLFTHLKAFMDHAKQVTEQSSKDKQVILDEITRVLQYNGGSELGAVTVDQTNANEFVANPDEESLPSQDDLFNSSTESIDTKTFEADQEGNYDKESTETLFEDIGKVGPNKDSTEHTAHLRGMLSNIINKVINPIRVKIKKDGSASFGATQGNTVYLNIATKSSLVDTPMSGQETYVHELLHNVTQYAVNSNPTLRHELQRLFDLTQDQVTAEDFINTAALNRNVNGDIIHDDIYAIELKAATDLHDHMFHNRDITKHEQTNSTGIHSTKLTSNGLHEFAVLGTTNERVMNVLKGLSSKTPKKGKTDLTFFGLLSRIMTKIIDYVYGKITNTDTVQADEALQSLVAQLAGINKRKRSIVFYNFDVTKTVLEPTTKVLIDYVAKPIHDLANSNFVKKNKFQVVQSVGKVVNAIPTAEFTRYKQVMVKVAERMGASNRGIFLSLLKEIEGYDEFNDRYTTLLRKAHHIIDGERKDIATGVGLSLVEAFETRPSQQQSTAITKALLMTDVDHLRDVFSEADIITILKEPTALAQRIKEAEARLIQFKGNQHYYRRQAHSLGSLMVTGGATEWNTMQNAYNIATLVETEGTIVGDVQQAEFEIDTLASLVAISLTNQSHRSTAAALFEKEPAGVRFALQVRRGIKVKALDQQFNGQKALMIKGYVKEAFNPNKSFTVAPASEEGALAKDNYQRGELIPRDPMNPNQEDLYFYTSTDGAVDTWMAGIFSLTNEKARGSSLIKVREQAGNPNVLTAANQDAITIKKRNAVRVAQQFTKGSGVPPTGTNFLVPIVSGNQQVTGYRYMMKESTKERVLEKDNSFDAILGSMEGQIADKVNSKEVNRDMIKTAYDDFVENFAKNSDEFVAIGERVADKNYRDLFRLLPEDTRKELKRVWGNKTMYVRKELVTLIFGDRKISVSNMKYTDDKTQIAHLKMSERFTNQMAKMLNTANVKTTENIWQEAGKLVKDTIVIKSGIVLADNIASNNWLLWLKGVSAIDLVKNQALALQSVTDYYANKKILDDLKLKLRVDDTLSATQKNNMQSKALQLNDTLARNPVAALIDNGIFQSIIEDIDLTESKFTFKSKLDEKVSPLTDKIPTSIKTLGKNLVMTHDTKVYRFMRSTTQFSDFVARFALHQHNLKNKKMTMQESLKDITETFINYDLPTHKGIQYSNDMMITPFTKFHFRIQRVILDTFRKAPARFLGLFMFEGLFGEAASIDDSLMAMNSGLVSSVHLPGEMALSAEYLPTIDLMSDLVK